MTPTARQGEQAANCYTGVPWRGRTAPVAVASLFNTAQRARLSAAASYLTMAASLLLYSDVYRSLACDVPAAKLTTRRFLIPTTSRERTCATIPLRRARTLRTYLAARHARAALGARYAALRAGCCAGLRTRCAAQRQHARAAPQRVLSNLYRMAKISSSKNEQTWVGKTTVYRTTQYFSLAIKQDRGEHAWFPVQ